MNQNTNQFFANMSVPVDAVPTGASEHGLGEDRILMFMSDDGTSLACTAKCSHMGGDLILDKGSSTAYCTKHHW